MMTFARGRTALLLPVLLCGVFACSLLAKRTELSCERDDQCQARLGAPGRCSAEGVCEAIVAPEAGQKLRCDTAADCQVLSTLSSSRCVNNLCVPLKDTEGMCDKLTEGVADEQTILLGVFYTDPSTLPTGSTAGKFFHYLTEKAVSDWNATTTGGKTSGRRMAAILCNDAGDTVKAVQHMQRLGVSAIIAPLAQNKAQAGAAEAIKQETPYLTPYDQSAVISTGTRACAPVRQDLAPAVSTGIKDIIASVSAARGRAVNVTLVSTNLPADDELRKALMPKLTAGVPSSTVAGVAEFPIEVDLTQPIQAKGKLIPRSNPLPDVIILNAEYYHYSLLAQIDINWTAPTLPVYVLIGQGHTAPGYERGQLVDGGAPLKTLNNRTYLLNWAPVPAPESPGVRSYVDQIVGASQSDVRFNLQQSDFAYFANDCLYTAMFASAAAVAKGNIEPNKIRNDSFKAGIDLISSDQPRISMSGLALTTAKSLLATPSKFGAIGANGPMQWGTDGKRIGLDTVELRCLKNGDWVTNKRTYSTITGDPNGPFECP
ncbi:MAG: hypothetical protein U0174_22340 [Polyangiaceae bacterium]